MRPKQDKAARSMSRGRLGECRRHTNGYLGSGNTSKRTCMVQSTVAEGRILRQTTSKLRKRNGPTIGKRGIKSRKYGRPEVRSPSRPFLAHLSFIAISFLLLRWTQKQSQYRSLTSETCRVHCKGNTRSTPQNHGRAAASRED